MVSRPSVSPGESSRQHWSSCRPSRLRNHVPTKMPSPKPRTRSASASGREVSAFTTPAMRGAFRRPRPATSESTASISTRPSASRAPWSIRSASRSACRAQGYPFAAPSGIVDQTLRVPSDKPGASIVANFDSFGTLGLEVDGSLPLSATLSVRLRRSTAPDVAFPDGTDNFNHTESLIARWSPAPGIEIMPFWSSNNDYNDEAGTFYVPAGNFLPNCPSAATTKARDGPTIATPAPTPACLRRLASRENWVVRLGAFRSVIDQKHSFTQPAARRAARRQRRAAS